MSTRLREPFLQDAWSIVALCIGVVIVSLALAGHTPTLDEALILALINLMMVTGLYVFVGLSGVVSFGQVSFMAIGAYVCGMFTIPTISKGIVIPNAPSIFLHNSPGTTSAVILGGVVAGFFALTVSGPLMRLTGIAASIGTLSLLVITNTFFTNWAPGSLGGGNLTQVPTDTSVNSALVWVVIALVGAFVFRGSRWGLRLRASREDEIAATAVGVNVRRERRIAFTISGLMFGVAGGLYGHTLGSFAASDFYLSVTFITLAMLVVGGQLSLFGAVLGTALLSVIAYVFQQWTNDSPILGITLHVPAGLGDLVIAGVLLLVLLLRPEGLTRGREIPLPRAIRFPRNGSSQKKTEMS